MQVESPNESEINMDSGRDKTRLELGHASLLDRAASSPLEPDKKGDSSQRMLLQSDVALNNVSYLPDLVGT